jgi:hypothetical protein
LITKLLEAPIAGNHPMLIQKGTKAAAAEAAVTAAEAIAVEDSEEAMRLAAEFKAMGGGALTMALAQEAEPGGPLRECWLAQERLRVSESRSVNRAVILTARTDAVAEVAEVAAAEAAAAEAAAAVEAVDAAEALMPPRGPPRKLPPMRLARERPWRTSFKKSLAAARAAWPRTPRRSPGGPCLVWGPRGIENLRRVAQQRGS